MPNKNEITKLFDSRYLTLVTRFLVDKEGNIKRGNLVDLDGKTVGQFRQLDELPKLIGDWLKARKGKSSPPSENVVSGKE